MSKQARGRLALVLVGAIALLIVVGVIAALNSSGPTSSVPLSAADRAASPALLQAAESVGFQPVLLPNAGEIERRTIIGGTQPWTGGIAVGAKAPAFTLRTPTGKAVSLASLRGKTVLLEFFATWCPHCNAEARPLNALSRTLSHARYAFLSINADGENAASVLAFHIYYGVPFPALLDPGSRPGTFHDPGSAGPVTSRYHGSDVYPTFYVLDPQGRVTWAAQGEQPDALLLRELRLATV